MTDEFEDHCWKDIVTPDIVEIYAAYRRKVRVAKGSGVHIDG